MPILGGCCFCFDLKVGTKIIGALNLVGGILNSLMFAVLLVMMMFLHGTTSIASSINDGMSTNPPSSSSGSFFEDDYTDAREGQPPNALEIVNDNLSVVKIILYVLLAVSLLLIITSSMLIHGVRHKRRGLLIPFMMQEVLNLLVFLGLGIVPLVFLGTHYIAVVTFLSFVGSVLFRLYFLLVVVSQYQALGMIRMHEEMSMK